VIKELALLCNASHNVSQPDMECSYPQRSVQSLRPPTVNTCEELRQY